MANITPEQAKEIVRKLGFLNMEHVVSSTQLAAVINTALMQQEPHYGIIDPDYARIYTQIRCTAWMYGHAALVHGSFTRDLDILIVPWDENSNYEQQHIIDVICSRCGLKKNGHPPTSKPNGRTSYTLIFPEFGDPRWVDISFTPKVNTTIAKEQ